MFANDRELESAWLSAWAPFAGSSPRDVRYLAHYPHDRFKRAELLNQALEMTASIEVYRQTDWKSNVALQVVTVERLSSQFIDCILALFIQISPLWLGVQVPLSRDCRDIMNLSIATTLVLREGQFVPLLSALKAMITGLAQNFNSSEAVNNLQAIPLDVLKLELFNELKLLTLNHPYRSGVDRKRISDFLTQHAVPREGYPIDSVVGMFKSVLNRIQLKEHKRDFITDCSNILDKADVWQQKHHVFALEDQLKLFEEFESHETDQGKPSKSAQKKRRKKENKLRRIAEKENSQSIRILSASKIQRQVRFYLNTRESAARTLQQYAHVFLQRMRCYHENQAASVISHFIRHVHDTRIQDRAALLINAFLAKAYYRKKEQNQEWFDQLTRKTQHAALVIRDCIEEFYPKPGLVLYGSRLLEGSSFGSYVVDEENTDLDLTMVLPLNIDAEKFLRTLMIKLQSHQYDFRLSGQLLDIFFKTEKKNIYSCQFISKFYSNLSIDLTFVQFEKNSPYANINTLEYLSKNILHADQFGLPLSGLTLGGLGYISVLSQRRLIRSVCAPNFSDIRTFSRNQVRNVIKKLLRALCINLSIYGSVPKSLCPTTFDIQTSRIFSWDFAKEILHQEIISLFNNKTGLLEDLLKYRGLHLFYGLLPWVLHRDSIQSPLFDPLMLFQENTPFPIRNPYYMIFAVQHFLVQANCINPSNYLVAMHGPLHFLNLYAELVWRMGMPELWSDCVRLYGLLERRTSFVNDYAQCRGQLFALRSIMRPCDVSQVSSNESYNTSDADTSTLSTLS